MTLPRWIGPGALVFCAFWLFLMIAGREEMLCDPGTFWHTTTGQIILKDGFLRHDPYTFTFPAKSWIPSQWLGEVGMAIAHRAGGFDTQFLGAVTILAAAFTFLTMRCLRTGLHPVVVGFVMALSLACASQHFHIRPTVVTLAGMVGTAAALVDCDSGRIRLRQLFWLVPCFIIWANIHGGYLAGYGLVVMSAVGWTIFWRLSRPSPVSSWFDVKWLALLIVCCGAAAVISPYGLDAPRAWRAIMGDPILKDIIKEHRPLDFSEPYGKAVIGLAALYAFLLLGVNWRNWRVTWLLPPVLLLQAIERCRHASLFAVVAVVSIAAIWPHTRWAKSLAEKRPDFYQPNVTPISRPWWAAVWLPVLLVLLSLVLQMSRLPVPIIGAHWANHTQRYFPIELLDVIQANEPQAGEANRLFNEVSDGGFIIFNAPGYKVFADDRCEIFGGEWLATLVQASLPQTPASERAALIAKWEEDYGQFAFALTRTESGFEQYFQSCTDQWELVKRSQTAAFYRRK